MSGASQDFSIRIDPLPVAAPDDVTNFTLVVEGEPRGESAHAALKAGAVSIGGKRYFVERQGDAVVVRRGNQRATLKVSDRPRVPSQLRQNSAATRHRRLVAPLPGQVVQVLVSAGDRVSAGQRLLTIEAMKMQNPISAEHAGTVARVHVDVGAAVKSGSLLVELDD